MYGKSQAFNCLPIKGSSDGGLSKTRLSNIFPDFLWENRREFLNFLRGKRSDPHAALSPSFFKKSRQKAFIMQIKGRGNDNVGIIRDEEEKEEEGVLARAWGGTGRVEMNSPGTPRILPTFLFF